jgi:hypothetical protein
MPAHIRWSAGATVLALAAVRPAAAQGSPYVPLDDPRLP